MNNRGIFIVGTDTEVGKTVVTAGILHVLLRQGINACSFKAAQSGGQWKDGRLIDGDTPWVRRVCSISEEYDLMNPYALQAEVSPHLAARLEGKKIERGKILAAYEKLRQKHDFIVAEGAGGLIVPLTDTDYFIYNLIQDLGLPVVIVSRAGLGAINHTILTLSFLQNLKIPVKGIIMNNFTGQIHEQDNIACIEKISGLKVLAVINHLEGLSRDPDFRQLKDEFTARLNSADLLD